MSQQAYNIVAVVGVALALLGPCLVWWCACWHMFGRFDPCKCSVCEEMEGKFRHKGRA